MGLPLDVFAKKYGLRIKSMNIDNSVSDFPRTILLPECPKCKNNLFLSHPTYRADPFIEHKRAAGVFGCKYPMHRRWLLACWTAVCDFFIALRIEDLVQCPECKKYFAEEYTLFDHMRYQCTSNARSIEMLKKAGVEKYMGGLMVV